MGFFITGYAETKQSEEKGKWYLENNLLYADYDGTIYLTPRNYKTDGYTIPSWIAWLGGDRFDLDIRPSSIHDFECQFQKELVVNLSIFQLREKGFLISNPENNSELLCLDIPLEFLELRETTFKKVNAKFKRMLECIKNIKQWRINAMFYAVHLNYGWIKNGAVEIDLNNLYKESLNDIPH